MPVPSPRNSIRIARGNYADLAANATEIGEGELCFAIDQDKFYSKSGGALVAVGGGTELYSIAQLGDVDPSGVVDGQVLVYSSSEGKWIPADQAGGGGAVESVNGQTGAVVLVISDLANDAGYITAAEAPVQVSDIPTNNNQLLNGAGYITSAEAPVQPGDVFSGDYNDLSNKPSIPSNLDDLADVNAASPSSGQFLQWNGSEWVPGAASGAPVDSVNGSDGCRCINCLRCWGRYDCPGPLWLIPRSSPALSTLFTSSIRQLSLTLRLITALSHIVMLTGQCTSPMAVPGISWLTLPTFLSTSAS